MVQESTMHKYIDESLRETAMLGGGAPWTPYWPQILGRVFVTD